MPPEKISLDLTAGECAVISSLLQRALRELVLLPATAEIARKLALRFAFVTDVPAPVQSTEADLS